MHMRCSCRCGRLWLVPARPRWTLSGGHRPRSRCPSVRPCSPEQCNFPPHPPFPFPPKRRQINYKPDEVLLRGKGGGHKQTNKKQPERPKRAPSGCLKAPSVQAPARTRREAPPGPRLPNKSVLISQDGSRRGQGVIYTPRPGGICTKIIRCTSREGTRERETRQHTRTPPPPRRPPAPRPGTGRHREAPAGGGGGRRAAGKGGGVGERRGDPSRGRRHVAEPPL